MKTFDEWLGVLGEPSKWGRQTEGNRDASWPCPMGGGDPGSTSLHVTEKGDGVLVMDFAHGHKKSELVEYLAGREQPTAAPAVIAKPKPSSGGARKKSETVLAAVEDSRGVRLPAASTRDPIAWYAAYCGVPEAWMRAEIPVRATSDGWIAHYWDTVSVTKDRQAGTSERRWTPKGAVGPRLWPAVPDEMPEEIWLCEGETDCIVLRHLGLEAFTAGGASQTPTLHEYRAMMQRGVERVVVAYDSDKAGREASDKAVESARAAGLGVTTAVLADPLLGGPKDWRERLLSGDATVPQTEAADWASQVWMLSDVKPAKEEDLLLGRLDPNDHTILFGDGGVGKGMLAAWWVALLSTGRGIEGHASGKEPMRFLIIDYEAHATTEWVKRIHSFGGDMDRVAIVQPDVPIWEYAATAREVIRALQIDYVVVDSALYACSGADPYQPEGATQYSLAVAQMQRPVLTLGHVTKNREQADKPFGSVFWHNGARLTISIEADGYDDPRWVRTRKASHGGAFSVDYGWDWVGQGLPTTLRERKHTGDVWEEVGEVIDEYLSASGSGPTFAQILDGLNDRGVTPPKRIRAGLSERFRSDGGHWTRQIAAVPTPSKRP